MSAGAGGWAQGATPAGAVALHLEGIADKTLRNLSAATRIGDSLFVAGDEFGHVIRLTVAGDIATDAATFELRTLLPLKDPDEEIDIEGLAADDGWLWVVGSHARTRRKLADDDTVDLTKLADLRDTRSRCLVARLPLVTDGNGVRPVRRDGARRAGMIAQGRRGGALAKALRHNPLLKPFTRIPAKEGGVDVEGIAVAAERVALGMRGPVIRDCAMILECGVAARPSGRLGLTRAPVPRLLALEGLGVRDLKRSGDDLLILAGPTTALSGPCALYRWRGWAMDPPHSAHEVRLHRPERVVELPFGRGVDHPEGLALWPDQAGADAAVLVICDSPAAERIDAAAGVIRADLFALPHG